jgi:hypothetical protein
MRHLRTSTLSVDQASAYAVDIESCHKAPSSVRLRNLREPKIFTYFVSVPSRFAEISTFLTHP